MVKGVCDGLLLNRVTTFSVHFCVVNFIPDLDYSCMDGEPKLCTVEHTSEGTDEKGALLLPLFRLYFAFLCFQTLLSLFSFRQWSVSLGNISQRPAAGWWTVSLKLLVSRIPGQKRPLDVCLHRPSLVDVKHHEFFKGSSFHFAQMPNRPQRGATQLIGGVSP